VAQQGFQAALFISSFKLGMARKMAMQQATSQPLL